MSAEILRLRLRPRRPKRPRQTVRGEGGEPPPDLDAVLRGEAFEAPELHRYVFELRGLLDDAVARRIERRLVGLSGVTAARIGGHLSVLTVSVLGGHQPAAKLAAVVAEHDVFAVERPEGAPEAPEPVRSDPDHLARRVLLRSLLLGVLGLVAGVVWASSPFNEQIRAVALNTQAILTGAMLAWAVRPLLGRTLRRTVRGQPAPELLPLVAGGVAFAASLGAFFTGGEPAFEAPILAWLGAALGHWVSVGLEGRARAPLMGLAGGLEGSAIVHGADGLFTVRAADVAIDDTVVVRHGDTVVADGVVVRGEAVVDGGPLSAPDRRTQVREADAVWAGQQVRSGALAVRAVRDRERSSLSRLARQQEAVGARSTWLEKAVASRLMAWTVLTLVVVAGIVALRLAEGAGFGTLRGGAIHAGIAAMLISAPLAVAHLLAPNLLVTAAAALRRGILFRNAAAIWRLARAGEVLFDRTGTLTCGQPELMGWVRTPGVSEQRVWELVLALEAADDHPVARALGAAARAGIQDVNAVASVDAIERVRGQGVSGLLDDGGAVHLGGRAHMMAVGLTLAGHPCEVEGRGVEADPTADSTTSPHTVVYLALDQEIIARFHLFDPVRSTARACGAALEEAGVRPGLVTGDAERAARKVSEVSGVPVAKAGVPAEELERWVADRNREAGGHVAVVTDVGHAGALRRAAGVSVVFGSGMRIGELEGDVTILGTDLTAVAEAVAMARQARRKAGWLLALLLVASSALWWMAAQDWLALSGAALSGAGMGIVAGMLSAARR